MDLALIAAIAAVFLLAGFVKGVIGLGLPTISVGLMALVMAPVEAAALLLIPSLATNVVQMLTGAPVVPLLRRFWPMMLAIVVGTFAAAGVLTGEDAGAAQIALGATLALYAAISLPALRFHVPPAAEPWLGPPVGFATGLVTGATGVFVIPEVPYLQALGLEKDDLVQALGLSFTVSTLALGAALAWHGALSFDSAGLSLLALAPALGGMALGTRIRGRISAAVFRRCFLIGLLLLGLHLALRPLL